MNAPEGYLSLNTTVSSSGAVMLSTMPNCALRALETPCCGNTMRWKRREHVLGGELRAVVELDVLADLEGVGLAAVRRLRHLGADVAHELLGRLVLGIDADQRAVERRPGMGERERRLAVTVVARRLVGDHELENAALLGRLCLAAGSDHAPSAASPASSGRVDFQPEDFTVLPPMVSLHAPARPAGLWDTMCQVAPVFKCVFRMTFNTVGGCEIVLMSAAAQALMQHRGQDKGNAACTRERSSGRRWREGGW